MTALEESRYIDLDTGDKVIIKMKDDVPILLFNERFRLIKLNDEAR